MDDSVPVVLAATIWLLKFLFFSGWYVSRWLVWLSWPIWTSAFGLGVIWGLM